MTEEQLIKIEMKLAHQEAMTEELNTVLYQQQQALEQIQKTLHAFIKRYKELEKSTQGLVGPADEKPPHY
jgi:SlyX protein